AQSARLATVSPTHRLIQNVTRGERGTPQLMRVTTKRTTPKTVFVAFCQPEKSLRRAIRASPTIATPTGASIQGARALAGVPKIATYDTPRPIKKLRTLAIMCVLRPHASVQRSAK